MKKNYTISVTLPMTLFVTVKNAKDEEEAKDKALHEAYKTDLDDWDIGSLECEVVGKTDVSTEDIKECPYCKSKNFEHMGENDYWNGMPWHCHECDQWFDEDVCEHERCWHQISALLNGTSEEKPFIFRKEYVVLPSVDRESQGLSELEKPNIEKIFQMEGDGTMFYHFEGAVTTDHVGNAVPAWEDMHELDTEDLKALLACIESERRPAEPLKGHLRDILVGIADWLKERMRNII